MEDNDTFRLSQSKNQSVKQESVHGHRNGESALRHVKNKVPNDESKTLGRKRDK